MESTIEERFKSYFPNLTESQLAAIGKLEPLYKEWNQQINVISRKDIDNLYLHHVLHAMAIAQVIQFKPGTKILDLGTGGGFPGIPLAILFPESNFHLIDGTRKKLRVVEAVVEGLELDNVQVSHVRAEELKGKYEFVVCRAVASIEKLNAWSMPLINLNQRHALPNGLLALKGGNLKAELKLLPKKAYYERIPLSDFFEEPFFEEKYLIYVQK